MSDWNKDDRTKCIVKKMTIIQQQQLYTKAARGAARSVYFVGGDAFNVGLQCKGVAPTRAVYGIICLIGCSPLSR